MGIYIYIWYYNNNKPSKRAAADPKELNLNLKVYVNWGGWNAFLFLLILQLPKLARISWQWR